MILDIRTISWSGKDDLPEEDEKDSFELLQLTQDSLKMLQIQNGESGQKGGRKEEGDRTQKMKVCRRSTRMNDEHRDKVTKGN